MSRAPQKIIRIKSHADRGMVTTASVLEVISRFSGAFTSQDVARLMAVREYQVRAAISWLQHRGDIEKAGERKSLVTRTGRSYSATTYRMVERMGPPDIGVLMKVLCHG